MSVLQIPGEEVGRMGVTWGSLGRESQVYMSGEARVVWPCSGENSCVNEEMALFSK